MIVFNTCDNVLCGFNAAMYCCDALLSLHVFFQHLMFVEFCFRLPIKLFDKTKTHFKNLGN